MVDRINNLKKLVQEANGLLPLSVYEEIFCCAEFNSCKVLVEVGTAHGAATIALALGAASREEEFIVWTVDRLGGKFSSRRQFGSEHDNKKIVLENFRRAGVDDKIKLFVGSADEFFDSCNCPQEIDLLMLDADGRIDRDLMHCYSKMMPGTPIIIDDVNECVYFNRDNDGVPYIDLKHRITSMLLTAYQDSGFIRVEKIIENTAFCRRGEREYDKDVFLKIAVSCYRELIFTDVENPFWEGLMRYHENSSFLHAMLRIRSLFPSWVICMVRNFCHIGRKLLG